MAPLPSNICKNVIPGVALKRKQPFFENQALTEHGTINRTDELLQSGRH